MRKPLYVHERDAHAAVVQRLKGRSLPPVVIHCFTGTSSEGREYVRLGCYIGVTGQSPRCPSLVSHRSVAPLPITGQSPVSRPAARHRSVTLLPITGQSPVSRPTAHHRSVAPLPITGQSPRCPSPVSRPALVSLVSPVTGQSPHCPSPVSRPAARHRSVAPSPVSRPAAVSVRRYAPIWRQGLHCRHDILFTLAGFAV